MTAHLVSAAALQHEIEQFLYHEAALLDERRFEEWLDLLADDIRYLMPTRTNRDRRSTTTDLTDPEQAAFFDETKSDLRRRVQRLQTGMAWAEEPPSRSRRIVTNVRIQAGDNESEYVARSNWMLYRTRNERDEQLFVGTREDRLRRVLRGAQWEIFLRTILLDQAVLNSPNLSVFF